MFFGALAALPIVGKIKPEKPKSEIFVDQAHEEHLRLHAELAEEFRTWPGPPPEGEPPYPTYWRNPNDPLGMFRIYDKKRRRFVRP